MVNEGDAHNCLVRREPQNEENKVEISYNLSEYGGLDLATIRVPVPRYVPAKEILSHGLMGVSYKGPAEYGLGRGRSLAQKPLELRRAGTLETARTSSRLRDAIGISRFWHLGSLGFESEARFFHRHDPKRESVHAIHARAAAISTNRPILTPLTNPRASQADASWTAS